MTRHILKKSRPSSAYLHHVLRIEREGLPRPVSLKLQRRIVTTDPARRVVQFVAIDRGRQA